MSDAPSDEFFADGSELAPPPDEAIEASTIDFGAPEGPTRDAPPRHEENAPSSWDHLVKPVPPEWFTTQPPPRTWLLRDCRREKRDGVFPAGKVGALIGPGGVSKTMAAIDLTIAVATGGKWLDTFECPTPGRVFCILAEEDEEEAWRRFYNVGHERRPHPAHGTIERMCLAGQPAVRLRDRDQHGMTLETPFLAWLRDYLTRTAPWALVYLDPIARFASPDAEKDNDEATRLVQTLEGLAGCARGSLVFSHHTREIVTGRGGRGSSAIFDACRWEATLESEDNNLSDPEAKERLGETVKLTCSKSNLARKFDPLRLRRHEGGPLVPLDAVDEELVGKASDTRAKKAEQKDAQTRERDDADDNAARELRAAQPKANVSELCATLRKTRACGQTRAHAAVVRTRRARA